MLGGIAPIILFNFFKLTDAQKKALDGIAPVLGTIAATIGLPPIPLYLDEKLTGIIVDSESHNIDIETSIEPSKTGEDPKVFQRPIDSVVNIEMLAERSSIGATILLATMDIILPKLASREYSISYINGPITIFGGLLHSFSTNQTSNDTLLRISMQLDRNNKGIVEPLPVVGKVTAAVPGLN